MVHPPAPSVTATCSVPTGTLPTKIVKFDADG